MGLAKLMDGLGCSGTGEMSAGREDGLQVFQTAGGEARGDAGIVGQGVFPDSADAVQN